MNLPARQDPETKIAQWEKKDPRPSLIEPTGFVAGVVMVLFAVGSMAFTGASSWLLVPGVATMVLTLHGALDLFHWRSRRAEALTEYKALAEEEEAKAAALYDEIIWAHDRDDEDGLEDLLQLKDPR